MLEITKAAHDIENNGNDPTMKRKVLVESLKNIEATRQQPKKIYQSMSEGKKRLKLIIEEIQSL